MKVKTKKGQILESNNPVIIGQWKKAGYAEIAEETPKKEAAKKDSAKS